MKDNQLKATLQELIALGSIEPGALRDDIPTIKQKIETYEQERYRGALIRARAEAWVMGETSTKRALVIEKAHMRRNRIQVIKENDIELTANSTITNAFLRNYQCLYAAAPVDIKKFKDAFLGRMPHLLRETTEALQSPITGSEIETVIDSLTP